MMQRQFEFSSGVLASLAITGLVTASPYMAQSSDLFKISPNQRISCSRALAPGKQQTISCKSYAYVMNAGTSEFYRCQVSVAVTRDAKAILKTEADGDCRLKARIFPEDSNYSFDATETEPPNTNAFFGSGGTAIWVSDATKLKVRGCIELVVGVAPDLMKCVDMKVGN